MSWEASPCCHAWSCEWVFSPGRLVIWGVVFGASSLGGFVFGRPRCWKVSSLDGRPRLWKVLWLGGLVFGMSRLRNVSSSECLVFGMSRLRNVFASDFIVVRGGCSSRQLTHLIKSLLNDYSNHLPLSGFVSLVASALLVVNFGGGQWSKSRHERHTLLEL